MYIYRTFSTVFFLDLLITGVLYCFDIEINIFWGYLFFLLLGLWIGSSITFSAIGVQKKYENETDKK